MQANGNYTNELFFVLGNGAKISLDYINMQTQQLIACADNTANNINEAKIIILYIGIGILGLSVGYVIFFVISLSKKINELWRFLSKVIFLNYFSLKGVYLNRLSTIYGIEEHDIRDVIIKEKPEPLNFKISFSQIWRFIWRLMIVTILSIIFSLVITLVYSTELENIIKYRPAMTNLFSRCNNDLQLMNFYTVDAFCYSTEFSLNSYFPEMNVFNNPFQEVNQLVLKFNNYKSDFWRPEYIQYMPTEVYSLLFNKVINDTTGYNQFGIYAGLINIADEIQYIVSTLDMVNYDSFMVISNNIYQLLESSSLILDNQLINNLNSGFLIIVIGTVIYSGLSILLYLFVYLPYLYNEAQHLHRIQSLAKLIKNESKRSS